MRYSVPPVVPIVGSFFLAMLLSLLPLSEGLWFRPQWVLLVLLYWLFYARYSLPSNTAYGIAWCIGFMMDILSAALIGQHILLLSILCYLASFRVPRFGVQRVWEQTMVLVAVLALSISPLAVLYRLAGHSQSLLYYGTTVVSSLLIWPVVYQCLRVYERKVLA